MVFHAQDRFDLPRTASATRSVSEPRLYSGIRAKISRFRWESTFAKISMDMNQTLGSSSTGLCSPQEIAMVRTFIRS